MIVSGAMICILMIRYQLKKMQGSGRVINALFVAVGDSPFG